MYCEVAREDSIDRFWCLLKGLWRAMADQCLRLGVAH